MNYKTVLTIAGSDGSGGAGIQADLKTFAVLGCYGLSAITAVTAQNTKGVMSSLTLPVSCIREQIKAILGDIRVDAVKIGMLGSAEIIKTVARLLNTIDVPVVLDTVLNSSSGRSLLDPGAIPVMIESLFPIAALITPNIPETILLTKEPELLSTRKKIEDAAQKLQAMGASAVLIKGGHTESDRCSDCLLYRNGFRWFSSKKIISNNTHGTGCTLSSAIAAGLAHGLPLESAVEKAKTYTFEAIRAGAAYRLGEGSGPLHHCYPFWK